MRGGLRPGGGRPKGAKTERTRAIAEQVAFTGETPLEVMLEGMRHYQAIGDRDKASAIAKDAAPYMHPRLNSVNVGGIPGSPVETKDASLPELARRIAFILGQAARESRGHEGSKRREILEAARHEIAHFYAEMLDGGAGHDEFSKIFDTTAFGYREIRIGIERPLRLSFQATPERLARLAEEKPIQKLDAVERQELLDALARRLPKQSFTNRRLELAKAT
jgi:hypothetical protein